MKKFIIIALLFLVLPATTGAEVSDYISDKYHYSVMIPNNWVEIPKTTIDSAMQKMADTTKGQFIDYSVGFQLDKNTDFQYPYILVQSKEVDTPSYNEIINTFKSDKFSKGVNEAIDNYSSLIKNSNFNEPFVDTERNIIFMNAEVVGAYDIGKIKILMAMFLGKENIIQFNFYSKESDYSKNLVVFNEIIDSFKYQQGYEYNEEEAKQNDQSNIWEDAIGKGIGGAIVGAIFVLIFRKKKGKQEIVENKESDKK